MKLKSVEIENYRAIEQLTLRLDPALTVIHGDNGYGKTSVLSAIAVGLGVISEFLPNDTSGLDFRSEDQREGAGDPRVSLTPMDGTTWERQGGQQVGERAAARRAVNFGRLLEELGMNNEADLRAPPDDLPIVAFFSTDRNVSGMQKAPRDPKAVSPFPRYAALEGALSAHTDFKGLLGWFYIKENEELREQKRRRDFDYQLDDISAVRQAISSMLPEVSQPRTELNPARFIVSVESEQGEREELALDQLSGGYRIMLALAADLARRMAQGNPHLDDPLTSEAIVLIDEIELHLHPSWQQRVLTDLARTFPNTQFIVSTHSPQVLTTVKPEHIVALRRENGRIVAEPATAPTFGAEAGDVLSTEMGVDERPRDNDFVKCLEDYRRLVGRDEGESEEALTLRKKLETLSPRDPALDRADIEIRRRKLLKDMGKSR